MKGPSSSPAVSPIAAMWEPVAATKGTRTTGRHFVKWTGPNVGGSLMVAQRASPSLLAASSGDENSVVPIVVVGKSDSPIGFHILHTPRSAFRATITTQDRPFENEPCWTTDTALHVMMLLEPGSFVWSCGLQPDRHVLLQELSTLVSIAQLVAATSRQRTCVFPNHLVIAPHGWPADAPKKAEQELHDWLFKLEPTHAVVHSNGSSSPDPDAEQRNNMRLLLEASFLSLQVFAFPDPETLQYRDRVDQCLRSRWVAGCLEGWGVPAAPSSAPLQTTVGGSAQNLDVGHEEDDSRSGGSTSPRFPPLVFAETQLKLTRVERVMGLLLPSSPAHSQHQTLPFGAGPMMDRWLKERLEAIIDVDFKQHCSARATRITSQQAWETHDSVLSRCQQVAALEMVSSGDVAIDIVKTCEASVESLLQRVLVNVQEAEEQRRRLQEQRHLAQQNDRRGALLFASGAGAATDRDVWFPELVQRWVPRPYWFWCTTQGLGVLFVFVSLLLYTFWPRKS